MKTNHYKSIIKNKGLKLGWVASQLNISRPTLSAYLLGTREMPFDIEVRLKRLIE